MKIELASVCSRQLSSAKKQFESYPFSNNLKSNVANQSA